MDTRLIEPIGKRIHILFKSGKHLDLCHIHPMNADLDDVKKKINWEILIKYFGEYSGWGLSTVYNTVSGKPEPGDMFWVHLDYQNYNWDNFEGDELHCILPNGIEWNIDSRAINCDMKDDKLHRCWVRKGIPPNVTISKDGNTCHAGAGSIMAGDYHGFLRNGKLTSC